MTRGGGTSFRLKSRTLNLITSHHFGHHEVLRDFRRHKHDIINRSKDCATPPFCASPVSISIHHIHNYQTTLSNINDECTLHLASCSPESQSAQHQNCTHTATATPISPTRTNNAPSETCTHPHSDSHTTPATLSHIAQSPRPSLAHVPCGRYPSTTPSSYVIASYCEAIHHDAHLRKS
jgi:hypothetical protein